MHSPEINVIQILLPGASEKPRRSLLQFPRNRKLAVLFTNQRWLTTKKRGRSAVDSCLFINYNWRGLSGIYVFTVLFVTPAYLSWFVVLC